jgi:hypothetical protein
LEVGVFSLTRKLLSASMIGSASDEVIRDQTVRDTGFLGDFGGRQPIVRVLSEQLAGGVDQLSFALRP